MAKKKAKKTARKSAKKRMTKKAVKGKGKVCEFCKCTKLLKSIKKKGTKG
mgnify:CR=1 FL=1